MRSTLICILCVFLAQPLLAAQPKGEVSEAFIQENLSKIPTVDPAPNAVPPLREAIRGKHPRLLLTAEEAVKLKETALADPVLKPVYNAVASYAKKFALSSEDPPPFVLTDTPAISGSAQQYPAAAIGYMLDRDPVTLKAITAALTVMLKQEHWALGRELDSNMGAGCNMLMTGLLFDAVRDDLEPEFRAKIAAKMLVHARRMHWLGHKQLGTGTVKYWQQDPQPNHRWYRAAGLAACLLAIADEPGLETGYLMEQLKQEMDFLIKWFPKEGDCHEGSGYQVFGFCYLTMAASMMDRAVGTEYLKAPGFRNAWQQQVYYTAPGRMGDMSFGDAMNGEGGFGQNNTPFFIGPQLSRDKNAQAALLHNMEQSGQPYLTKFKPQEKRTFVPPWGMLLFYDPTVGSGDYRALPTARLFPDLGAANMRNSWENDAVAFAFKCGPHGGYRLNEYAWEYKTAAGEPHYVNVAHDDSDANSFSMSMAGEHIFHPGLYSWSKLTAKQSCVTVDGVGQLCEGADFTQPVPGKTDMRTISYLTGWKQGEQGRIIIEGEAANAYRGVGYYALVARQKGSPATETKPEIKPIPGLPDPVLKHFRRSVIWLPNEYILMLDDIIADGKHAIMWRGTVEKAFFDDPAQGLCHIATKGGKHIGMQMLADRPFTGAIDFMHLDGRFGNLMQHQFQFTADSDAVKFACLLDPWGKKAAMTLTAHGGAMVLRVQSTGFDDTWTWQ
ncbi:MAG: hypothetical protein AAB263_03000 [Planctomycetota bacterium]